MTEMAAIGCVGMMVALLFCKGHTSRKVLELRRYLAALESDQSGIMAFRTLYRDRLDQLIELMTNRGMRLAIEPRAAFYTLWQTPATAFGTPVESGEQFNFMMIEKTGVVGVHFGDYIRYAVCADVDAMQADLNAAFAAADVTYSS